MKTRHIFKTMLIAMTAILFISGSAYADGVTPGKEKKIRKLIGMSVDYPEFAKTEHLAGDVLVDLSIDETGKVKINEINGHPRLIEYVKTKLTKLIVRPDEEITGKSLLYKFIFKQQ